MDTPPLVAMKPQGLEEQSIIQAIVDIMQPTIENEDDLSTFFLILQDIFPLSRNSKSASSQYQDTKLVNAVRDQLNEDNIKETQEIMDKVLCFNPKLTTIFVLKMSSTFNFCGKNSSALQTRLLPFNLGQYCLQYRPFRK